MYFQVFSVVQHEAYDTTANACENPTHIGFAEIHLGCTSYSFHPT